MDCSPPGSSVHGILQARILEWVAIPSSRGSSNPGIEPASFISPALAGIFITTSAFRLAEIMSLMIKHHLEPKRMRLVYPYVDKEPNIVLIEGLKGGKSRITVEPPLIVYDAPGVYTEELKRMYYEV